MSDNHLIMVSAHISTPEEIVEIKRIEEEMKQAFGKILCPFCSAPWTENMIQLFGETSQYDSTNYSVEVGLKITCQSCNKLIYEK